MSDADQLVSRKWHRWGEPLAVALNLSYTLGYQKMAWWTFPAGALGSLIFLGICWNRRLVAESFLWVYYVGMAVYGAFTVQAAWPDPLPVASLEAHGISISIGLASWFLLYFMLRRTRRAFRPGLDSFTTVGSIIATYWMLQFVEANWLYWIVINAAAVWLYWERGLRWGAGLFVLYTFISIEGWFDWI